MSMQSSKSPTIDREAAYAESMYAFFRRARVQNIAGQSGASIFLVAVTWNLADHAVLIGYLIIHQLLVALSSFCFYSSWTNKRRNKQGLPKFVLETGLVTKTFCGSLLWFDLEAAQDTQFVIAVLMVMAGLVAGTMITLGPLKQLARSTLISLLLPSGLACMYVGLTSMGIAVLFFLWVVAQIGVNEMHRSYSELIALRAEAAAAGKELERNNLELRNANECLETEIARREATEREREALQEELIDASREAGKAEIATGVLHNIGNVLNSVNVTTDLMQNKLKDRLHAQLDAAVKLLEEQDGDLPTFFSDDPRGKHFVPFMGSLNTQAEDLLSQVEELRSCVDHANSVVAAQQSFATTAALETNADVQRVIDTALQITSDAFGQHDIKLNKDYETLPEVLLDRQKVIQILVNLLRNAKHAIEEYPESTRQVTIGVKRENEEQFSIEIRDSGIGISQENLEKIFQHGFSTRKSRGGHGFGLHHSICSMEEMGGRLDVSSEGKFQGASFKMTFPLKLAAVEPTEMANNI